MAPHPRDGGSINQYPVSSRRASAASPPSCACRMCRSKMRRTSISALSAFPGMAAPPTARARATAPRQMRDMSSMVRRMHQTTHVVPYDLANVADLGDCPVNPANVDDALDARRTLLPEARRQGHPAALGRRRSSVLAAGAARGRRQEAGGHDPFRCPYRSL